MSGVGSFENFASLTSGVAGIARLGGLAGITCQDFEQQAVWCCLAEAHSVALAHLFLFGSYASCKQHGDITNGQGGHVSLHLFLGWYFGIRALALSAFRRTFLGLGSTLVMMGMVDMGMTSGSHMASTVPSLSLYRRYGRDGPRDGARPTHRSH